jgi:hypothetical protein
MHESDSEYERKRQLECLRLASDLVQLAKGDLEPALKAHCLRMARAWTDQAEKAAPSANASCLLN